jgi:hypothetical protein
MKASIKCDGCKEEREFDVLKAMFRARIVLSSEITRTLVEALLAAMGFVVEVIDNEIFFLCDDCKVKFADHKKKELAKKETAIKKSINSFFK